VFESDAAVVVKWVNERSHLNSDTGVILADILKLLDGLNVVKVCYVPRLANEAAHGLAKFALRCDDDRYWMEEFPNCINDIITKEATVLA
jgi:hypothetical protein